jgi:hypothetical protein
MPVTVSVTVTVTVSVSVCHNRNRGVGATHVGVRLDDPIDDLTVQVLGGTLHITKLQHNPV